MAKSSTLKEKYNGTYQLDTFRLHVHECH